MENAYIKSAAKSRKTVARSEDSPPYAVEPVGSASNDDDTIARALAVLSRRLRTPGCFFTSTQSVKDYVKLHMALLPREEFRVLLLDAQHGMLHDEVLFKGTLTQTSVYPREVVRLALQHNAAAVILAHNHPSGHPEPSRADEMLTTTLSSALRLVDIRVLDHIVVGGDKTVSFAERGML